MVAAGKVGKVLSQILAPVCAPVFRFSYLRRSSSRICCANYAGIKQYYTLSKKHSLSNLVLSFPVQKLNCSQGTTMGALSPMDPSSYSRPELAIVKHVSLKLNIDFEQKVLNGNALLSFEILQEIQEVILDVRDQCIQKVELEDGTPLSYKVDGLVDNFGSKLTIEIPTPMVPGAKPKKNTADTVQKISLRELNTYISDPCGPILLETIKPNCRCNNFFDIRKGKYSCDQTGHGLNIRIIYTTSPTASALQWLGPNQTSSKKYPYLFSQCQPIHARSIMPCQDTPYVKFTYDAEVTAPEEFTILMSAIRNDTCEKVNGAKKTRFNQPTPIPSYLLAIAVGVLEARRLGPRSIVWSEKEEVDRSAWEFNETERYLQAAERLCGRYEWTQYDLLVLPPSFPYGGMENPCLTFVTPTLLAGDRSQADVIVHEIMHSWTGNLITNRNFEHFWLNEGFTVFLERKVAASLIADSEEARKSRDFHSILGLQELNETIKDELGIDSPLTSLVVDLKSVHPDDAFSTVPYEKGSLFLRVLEEIAGGPAVFDNFLRSYLQEFKFKSLDTDQFKSYLLDYFKDNKALHSLDWNSWLYSPGMPPTIPNYDATMTKACSHLVAFVMRENSSSLNYENIKTFTPHQVIHFLQQLLDGEALPLEKLRVMGDAYQLSMNKNTEILYRWLRLCIKSRDEAKLSDVFNFINSQGRMKYVRPIYRDLYSWEKVRSLAIKNFLDNEPYMMHVSAYTLRKDLHLSDFDIGK